MIQDVWKMETDVFCFHFLFYPSVRYITLAFIDWLL